MKRNSLVSIIMPIYNTEFSYFDASVESILKQNYTNFELILIDDGSTKKNSDYYKKTSYLDKRIEYYKTINGGASAARNYGIVKAEGDYIVMVDSDDTINDTYISELLAAAEHTGTDIVYPKIISEDNKDKRSTVRRPEKESLHKNITPLIEENWNFSFVGSLIESEKAKKAQFNTDLKFFEDIDYMLQLLKHSDYCRCEKALYCYKKRSTSATNSFTSNTINEYIDDSIMGIQLAGNYFPDKRKQIDSIVYSKVHNYAKKVSNLDIAKREKLALIRSALNKSKNMRKHSKIHNSPKNLIKKISVDINSPSILLLFAEVKGSK